MSYQLLQGDCITVLRTLEAYSVSCCVTSPPYYGLRDYGTAAWMHGDPECDHTYAKGGRNPETSSKQISSAGTTFSQYEKVCKRCGAQRIDSQIGLEETPDAYVAKLVQVFREVHRVLRDDGTLWLNLGDSYAGSGGAGEWSVNRDGQKKAANKNTFEGIKAKDLIGIPWMVAFALRADGWYLRSDIIWHKPNPMPEPVQDRPTKSHEYLFLLTKSAQYYYDADAIREPPSESTMERWHGNPYQKVQNENYNPYGTPSHNPDRHSGEQNMGVNPNGRNKRSVWTVATQPYAGAHFATFPPKLIEPCILAGSAPGGTVLDPFNGSGTTGAVALKHHRKYIGIDLNPAYIELTKKRFAAVQPVLFAGG